VEKGCGGGEVGEGRWRDRRVDGEMWRAEGWRGKTMEVGRAVNQKEPEANGSIDRLIVGPETLRRYCRAQIRFKFKLSSFCCSLPRLEPGFTAGPTLHLSTVQQPVFGVLLVLQKLPPFNCNYSTKQATNVTQGITF
jgi:hypothetical protein